jgi:hypothetical protein
MAAENHNAAVTAETASFFANYDARIADILALPSGQHASDDEALERWINAQASPRRRYAARTLAANLRYISHAEVIAFCKSLIDEMYTDATKPIPPENQLKWFVGPKTKSAYFIALICYHYAKQAGYRLPEVILSEHFTYEDCAHSTIFYLDDMSYSGSQLYQLLQKIHIRAAKENPKHMNKKKPVDMNAVEALPVDIRTGLLAITERAQKQLETFTYGGMNTIGKAYGKKPTPNPYKLYAGTTIPDLERLIGPQQYADCVIYFNPFRDSSCICYFDHKIADSNSTFLNVLRFGVVPPSELNYKFIYQHENRKWSKYKPYYNQPTDVCDKEILQTQLIPFIKGCPIDPKYRDQLQALPYHELMMVAGGPDEGGKDLEYGFYEINISKNPDLYTYKNSVETRCPHSWYKDGYFAAGGKRTRKQRKKRRAKTFRRQT